MSKLIGIAMVFTGLCIGDPADPMPGMFLICLGLVFLFSKSSAKGGSGSSGGAYYDAAPSQTYYSAITGKYYSSQEAKRRDEDLWTANYNASPHCW